MPSARGDLDLAAGQQVRVIDHDLLADLERCVASLRRGDEMPPAVGSGTGAVVELDFAGQPVGRVEAEGVNPPSCQFKRRIMIRPTRLVEP
jgi:hypothetical protein